MVNFNDVQKLLSTSGQSSSGWYAAMDCEMVGTGPSGSQSTLARVSIVDWNGNAVLDAFVQLPQGVEVTDYRTKVSGITPQDLARENDKAFPLEDIRYAVQSILHNKILIGHGLENDLSALMISHPPDSTRDTACYIPYMRPHTPHTTSSKLGEEEHITQSGRKLEPRKLKDLVKERLGVCVQGSGKAHDSIEDARAALELYKKARPEWEALVSRTHRDELRKQSKRSIKARNKKMGGWPNQAVTPVLESRRQVLHTRPQMFVEEQREPDHDGWSNSHHTAYTAQSYYSYYH
jgi:RNA exonuclease 4